jgi:hypothetical protein
VTEITGPLELSRPSPDEMDFDDPTFRRDAWSRRWRNCWTKTEGVARPLPGVEPGSDPIPGCRVDRFERSTHARYPLCSAWWLTRCDLSPRKCSMNVDLCPAPFPGLGRERRKLQQMS